MVDIRMLLKSYLYNKDIKSDYVLKLKSSDELEKYSIVSDAMFKAMFVGEAKKKNVAYFLSFLFGIPYEEVYEGIQSYNSELPKGRKVDKGERCDLAVKFGNSIFDIELNQNSDAWVMERNIEYAMRLSADKVRSGSVYDYQRTLSININNFAFEGNDKVIDVYMLQNEEGVILNDKLIIVQIYLPNLRELWYTQGGVKIDNFGKLLLMLVEQDVKVAEEIATGSEIIKSILQETIEVSREELVMSAYDKEYAAKMQYLKDGREIGKEEGIKIGEEKGRQERNYEIAKKLMEEKISIDIIKKTTGLTKEEIQSLKEEMKKEENS